MRPRLVRLGVEGLEDRVVPYVYNGIDFIGTVTGNVTALVADGQRVWWAEDDEIRGVRKDDTTTVRVINAPGVRDLVYDNLFLYYVDGTSVRKVNPEPGGLTTALASDFGDPANGLGGHPTYLAIGSGPQPALYVTTASTLNRAVYRVDKLNGSTARLAVPYLAEDITAGNGIVAWVEPSRGRVDSALSTRLLGSPVAVYEAAANGLPTGGAGPQTLATDLNGTIFWVEGNGAVRRSAGGSITTLAVGTGGAHGSGLAVDNGTDGYVYFVNGSSIQYVPKNGDPSQVGTIFSGIDPVFLAVDADYVYCSTGTYIERFPKPKAQHFFPAPALQPSPDDQSVRAYGADAGGGPFVRLYDHGQEVFTVSAFDPAFTGGVRVAVADVNGDGVPDVIAAPGPGGGPVVRIFDGQDGTLLHEFLAFEASFTGGLFVAACDLDGDGAAEVVVSPDQGGGPRVRVLKAADGSPVADFFGIDDPDFRGGARVAVGDLNADGVPDLLVAAGFGGGPRIAGFDGLSLRGGALVKLFADFFVFEPTLRNGVYVAAGDLDGDGYADVIVGGGPGGAPRVFALSGLDLVLDGRQTQLANFFAGDPNLRGGVRLATADANGDGRADIIAAPGPGGPPQVIVYSGATRDVLDNFLVFPADFAGGVFAAGSV